MVETDLQREFSYLQAAEGSSYPVAEMGQHCSVALHTYQHLPSPGVISGLLLRDLSLPWQAWKWAGVTLQTPPLPVSGFLLHPSSQDDPIHCSRGTKAEISAMEQWGNTQPRNGLNKKWGAHEFSETYFSVLEFSAIPIPVELPSIIHYYFPVSQKVLGRRKRHYSWRILCNSTSTEESAVSGHSVIKTRCLIFNTHQQLH